MRIQIRKCPFTGKTFEEKDIGKYIWHLKKLRDNMREERRLTQIKNSFTEWLKKEKEKIVAIDMIVPWILREQRHLMDGFNACGYSGWSKKDKFFETDEFRSIVLDIQWTPLASNSHNCPEGGVTNWCAQDKTKPAGYPGWSGNIGGSLKRAPGNNGSYPYGDFLEMIKIHRGTGGGGNEHWGYDVKLYATEWPGLAMEQTINRLKGR
jgi:hypothetical protein